VLAIISKKHESRNSVSFLNSSGSLAMFAAGSNQNEPAPDGLKLRIGEDNHVTMVLPTR
jgi:hypothetical protein